MSAVRLASAGFEYTGQDAQAICRECRTVINGLRPGSVDLNPLEEHLRRSPQCSVAAESLRSHGNDSSHVDLNVTFQFPPESLSLSGPTSNILQVYRSALSRAQRRLSAAGSNPGSHVSEPPIDRNDPDFDRLRRGTVRLRTFHDWPPTVAASPTVLARDGWFYTGQFDRVRCAFCRGVLRNWVAGDEPSAEHRRHFPDCPFVREANINNVRREEELLGDAVVTPVGDDRGSDAVVVGRVAEVRGAVGDVTNKAGSGSNQEKTTYTPAVGAGVLATTENATGGDAAAAASNDVARNDDVMAKTTSQDATQRSLAEGGQNASMTEDLRAGDDTGKLRIVCLHSVLSKQVAISMHSEVFILWSSLTLEWCSIKVVHN
jgi:hypothetical protein